MYRELKDSDKEKESGKTVSASLTEDSVHGGSNDGLTEETASSARFLFGSCFDFQTFAQKY